jgi:hypothetical protein
MSCTNFTKSAFSSPMMLPISNSTYPSHLNSVGLPNSLAYPSSEYLAISPSTKKSFGHSILKPAPTKVFNLTIRSDGSINVPSHLQKELNQAFEHLAQSKNPISTHVRQGSFIIGSE